MRSKYNRVVRRRQMIQGSLAAGVGGAALIAVGCGDDDDSGSGEPTSPSGPTSTAVPGSSPSASAGQPRAGGTLRQLGYLGGAEWDPAATIRAGAMHRGPIMVYDYLNRLGPNFELQAHMAELPEQVDEVTYVYTIRQGINWHDKAPLDGRAFTAQDAAFGLMRFGLDQPTFLFGERVNRIESFDVVDETTLRIITSEPFAPLTQYLAEDNMVMVSEEAQEEFGFDGLQQGFENMIGTGAWMPDFDEEGTRTRLIRNPNYWREGRPYLDAIEAIHIPDPALREAAFLSGEVDMNTGWGGGLTVPQIEALVERLGDEMSHAGKNSPHMRHNVFNCSVEPFSDPRVRRALHLAADREAAVADAGAGLGGRMMGPVPQSHDPYAFTEEELASMPGYRLEKEEDLAEARALLADAGYADGFSMSIVGNSVLSEILRDNWRAIGVDASVRTADSAEWLGLRDTGEFEMLAVSTTGAGDPDFYLYDQMHSTGRNNHSRFANDDVDRLAEQQRTTFDTDERVRIARELQELLLEELPQLWTTSIDLQYALKSNVRDFLVVPGYQGWYYADVWLEETD